MKFPFEGFKFIYKIYKSVVPTQSHQESELTDLSALSTWLLQQKYNYQIHSYSLFNSCF